MAHKKERELLIKFANHIIDVQNKYTCTLNNAEKEVDSFLPTLPEEKETCVHPWSAVVGDGEMQPAKCLACGKILS